MLLMMMMMMTHGHSVRVRVRIRGSIYFEGSKYFVSCALKWSFND